jgi:hypothetical protein
MWKIKILIVIILLSTIQIVTANSSASATFSGTTDPGAIIYVRVDDLPGCTTIANEIGYFKKTIENLETGPHSVLIYATDSKGRRSNEFITGWVIST